MSAADGLHEVADRAPGSQVPTASRRLPWYAPGELDEPRRAVYEAIVGGPRAADAGAVPLVDAAGRLHGPFNAMLANPEVGRHLQGLGAALRYATALGAREREIAVLCVARARRSGFEWAAHARLAHGAGLTSDQIAAILAGKNAPGFGARDALVRELTERLLDEGDLDDAAYARGEAELGSVALVDLVVLVGYYELLARMLRVERVPLPPGFDSPFP